MDRYEKILTRLRNGERIVIDGATGTEVERRGVPNIENAWSSGGAISHPVIVRDIHEEYIRCGAEVVISNTFATTRHALRDGGVENQFAELNRRGVELACEARDLAQRPDVLVAGGVSYWSFTGNHPSLGELEQDVTTQCKIMQEAGADLLMLEMMVDIDRMLVTLKGAQSCSLPVWVGLTCEPGADNKMCLRGGEPLEAALAALSNLDVPLVSIMHTDVKYIDECLNVMDEHWQGLVGVYAHVGRFVNNSWLYDETISPASYAGHCSRWMNQNVSVIGGCCGIVGEHIAALTDLKAG